MRARLHQQRYGKNLNFLKTNASVFGIHFARRRISCFASRRILQSSFSQTKQSRFSRCVRDWELGQAIGVDSQRTALTSPTG